MANDNNESRERLWFPARIRQLRIAAGKKQREVAEAIGMLPNSYANVESSNFKRLRVDRVYRLAKLYDLDAPSTDELVAGWEALPTSQYNQRMAKPWAERNARRAKIKGYDRAMLSLLEVTMLLIATVDGAAIDPGTLCACGGPKEPSSDMFDEPDSSGQPCELCDALKLLGLTGWTNLQDVTDRLAAVQEKMTG